MASSEGAAPHRGRPFGVPGPRAADPTLLLEVPAPRLPVPSAEEVQDLVDRLTGRDRARHPADDPTDDPTDSGGAAPWDP